MKKFKAIISDIDGTLTAISPHAYPSRKVTEAIKNAVEKGAIFSLASGRPFFLVEYLLKHLRLSSPTITDNGAVISDSNGKVLWQAALSADTANRILDFTKEFGLVRASCDIGGIDNPSLIPGNAMVRKISVHDITEKQANGFIKAVQAVYKNLELIRAASYKGNEYTDVNVSSAEATKQHAVIKYVKLLDLKTEEIIGIGDGYNDFPLLMACGLKVAMGNAVDDIKAIADYVAPSVDEDGIVDVIEKFVL